MSANRFPLSAASVAVICGNPQCKKTFMAARRTRKFCSDRCRTRVARRTSPRAQVLTARYTDEEREIACDDCGASTWETNDRWYVYGPPGAPVTTANARLRCPGCHSATSRKKFRENHPDAGPGWGRQRALERAAQGLPKRKPGFRPPREILVDPADFERILGEAAED